MFILVHYGQFLSIIVNICPLWSIFVHFDYIFVPKINSKSIPFWFTYSIILFTFRDPLSLNEDSKSGCNGENGHLEDPTEDPLDTNGTGTTSSLLKKKRKSSAEKFLEEQSEYYGFQVRILGQIRIISFLSGFLVNLQVLPNIVCTPEIE